MIIFKIKGIVREKETGTPLLGLVIKAYDKDLLFDDLLGSAISGQQGEFEIVSEIDDFREFFDVRPDIYFKVYRGDHRKLVHTTDDSIRWNAGRLSEFEILIPGESLYEPAGIQVVLTGDTETHREEFEIGESLTIQARGLRPVYTYDIGLNSDGKELFTSRLITNLYGDIEPTILWPQMGLDDPNSNIRYTPDEAWQRWEGKTLTLTIASGLKQITEQNIRINQTQRRPLVLSTDRNGRLLNGFEVGSQPVYITLRNLPFSGAAQIFMVQRQHDWREGDQFQLARLSNGSRAVREVDLPDRGEQTTIEFAAADVLMPGAYDFIIRPLRYGFEENEVLRLLSTDLVGSRHTTGIVIREGFWSAKPVLGGCVNKISVSGRSVAGAPYFRYADTFEVGENVYAALDPGIVDPGNISKMCALYVIPSKDDLTWNVDNSLAHLAVLGGNAAVQKIKVQSGCINANKLLVWPGATQPGSYDIIADFGNNTSDAANFIPDNTYNTPLDIIDGYFVAGFRVVEDPGTLADFSHAGNWNYNENTVNGMGLQGVVTVQDELDSYHTAGSFSTVNTSVPLRAHVYFPADFPSISDPAQISGAQVNYPLVGVVHGNGHSFTSYDFLLQHFAKNGFIAAGIHLVANMSGLGRANVFFHHLAVLQAKFGTSLQNNIGIMGHSRGGEAVLKVARLNQQQGLGHNFNAIISLAPTDQYGSEVLGGAWAKPYLVIYGTRDGDVAGWPPYAGYTVPNTGFALYDRCSGNKKSMVFVYGATHNGFITVNDDGIGGAIPEATQQNITKAYMNAFFRQYLKNEPKWQGIFTGEWQPASVSQTGVKLYVQYRDPLPKTVDDFESIVSNWRSSTIGGTVAHNATLPADPEEGIMRNLTAGLDPNSPHDTKGLKLHWNNLGDMLVYTIPAADKDISGFSVLSFRVTQKVASPHNPANQVQNLRVALKDLSNNERAVRVSAFGEIPYPDDHPFGQSFTKSALNTIRIPLTSYSIVCAGQPQIDLQNIVSLSLLFSEIATGDIDIDDVEFSN